MCKGSHSPHVGNIVGARKNSADRGNSLWPYIRKGKKCPRFPFGRIALRSNLKLVNSWRRRWAKGCEGHCCCPPIREIRYGIKPFSRSALACQVEQFASTYPERQFPARGLIIHPFEQERDCIGANLFDRSGCFVDLLDSRRLTACRATVDLDPVRQGMALSRWLVLGGKHKDHNDCQDPTGSGKQQHRSLSHARSVLGD